MASLCSVCSRKTTDKDRILCFGGCGLTTHAHCTDLTSTALDALKENISLEYFCPNCHQLQITLADINKKCSKMITTTSKVLAKFEEFQQSLQAEITAQIKRNFDNVVSAQLNSIQIPNDRTPSRSFAETVSAKRPPNTIPDTVTEQHTALPGPLRSGKQRLLLTVPSQPKPVSPALSNTKPSTNTPRDINKPPATALTQLPRSKPALLSKIEQTVVIKSKVAQDANATKADMINLLNPVDLEVKNVRTLPSGDIAIRCATASSALKLLETINKSLATKCDTTIQAPLKPRIKITGFSKDIDENEFITLLKRQNNLPEFASINVIKFEQTKTQPDPKGLAIIEPDPPTFEHLIRRKTVNIGWDRCRIFEQIDVRRCFQCSEYGHLAANCLRPTCCPKCAEGHSAAECTSDFAKCINCETLNKASKFGKDTFLDTAHPAWSTLCPVYQKKTEIHYVENKLSG